MPRKPLAIFIEGLLRVAMKITKGFQNMGTDVKLLFKQLVSYLALRAIPHFPHRPVVVAVTSGKRFYYMRLRSVCSFRLHCAPGTTFVPHSEPLRSIMPAFVHPPQHPTA